jgi:hypothetical protein
MLEKSIDSMFFAYGQGRKHTMDPTTSNSKEGKIGRPPASTIEPSFFQRLIDLLKKRIIKHRAANISIGAAIIVDTALSLIPVIGPLASKAVVFASGFSLMTMVYAFRRYRKTNAIKKFEAKILSLKTSLSQSRENLKELNPEQKELKQLIEEDAKKLGLDKNPALLGEDTKKLSECYNNLMFCVLHNPKCKKTADAFNELLDATQKGISYFISSDKNFGKKIWNFLTNFGKKHYLGIAVYVSQNILSFALLYVANHSLLFATLAGVGISSTVATGGIALAAAAGGLMVGAAIWGAVKLIKEYREKHNGVDKPYSKMKELLKRAEQDEDPLGLSPSSPRLPLNKLRIPRERASLELDPSVSPSSSPLPDGSATSWKSDTRKGVGNVSGRFKVSDLFKLSQTSNVPKEMTPPAQSPLTSESRSTRRVLGRWNRKFPPESTDVPEQKSAKRSATD